jgi:hypothetical protein
MYYFTAEIAEIAEKVISLNAYRIQRNHIMIYDSKLGLIWIYLK